MKFHLVGLLTMVVSIKGLAQSIGTFSSVQPTAQTQNLVLPVTHTFQRILRSGSTLASGEIVGNNLDFTGYVPISGSSTNGYLSVSSETYPASCAILNISLNGATRLWTVSNSGNVPLPFGDLGISRTFCAGTVTPNNRVMVCEETALHGDDNGDGYNDDGWVIEIDPATRTVINQDGVGGVDKLWAMGRTRHEDIVIKSDMSVAYLSADDATYGYVYKFVPTVPGNFSSGSLFVLQTNAGLGTGTWVPVANTTQAERNSTQSLSMAAGAFNFSRVEGIEMGPDGKLYFASATSGNIYRFQDVGTTVDQLQVFVASTSYDVDGAGPYTPEPWGTGADNLAFDGEGNLWVLQDGDRSHIWVVAPDHTAAAPKVRLFATTPAGSEPTGITFSPDFKYLFMSIQHPNVNTVSQTDAAGNSVVFDQSTTIVIARREDLGGVVLPLSLTSFNALQRGLSVELTWARSTIEEGVFEIERSTDGRHFEVIGKQAERRNSFLFIDQKLPASPVLYYRLKFQRANGRFDFSQTNVVRIEPVRRVFIYPSPLKGRGDIVFHTPKAGRVQIEIFNPSGALVHQIEENASEGANSFALDLAKFSSGIYHLFLLQEGTRLRYSFLKN